MYSVSVQMQVEDPKHKYLAYCGLLFHQSTLVSDQNWSQFDLHFSNPNDKLIFKMLQLCIEVLLCPPTKSCYSIPLIA